MFQQATTMVNGHHNYNNYMDSSWIDENSDADNQSVRTDIIPQVYHNRYPASSAIKRSYETLPRYNSEQNLTSVGAIYSGTDVSTQTCDIIMKKVNRKLDKKKCAMDYVSKFNEIKFDTDKSPINKLNEIMLLLNKQVDYHMIGIEGEVHSPCFTFEARSDDMSARGSGSTKREAKKEAAISFLNKIEINNCNNTITSTTLSYLPLRKNLTENISISNDQPEINSVGKLQELCIAYHWPLPDYNCSYNTMKNQYSCYSVICTLKIYRSKGEGKTKQAAKRQAAHLMYEQIKNFMNDNSSCDDKFQTPNNISQNNIKSVGNTKETKQLCHSNALELIQTSYHNLKLSARPSINKLKDLHIDSLKDLNAIEFLKHIRDEENFDVDYREILNKLNEVIILVEVSLNPMVVHLGTGKTLDEAKESGAYVVLVYLKLLLQN